MSDERKAVFLSYASQDAESARRICEALRAAGVEVWFDQSELVGGDAWDGKIRKQISECALFVPVISAATQARREGYFRLEWKLAAQRMHMIADGTPFLFPVVIDDTRDAEALVPAEFKVVQWTKLLQGEAAEKFCTRVQRLLGGEDVGAALRRDAADESRRKAAPTNTRMPRWVKPVITGVVVAAAVLALTLKTRFGAASASAASSPSSMTLARARSTLDKFDVTRAELDLAGELLAQAAKSDPANARVFASWALVDCRYLSEYYDRSSERRDAASRHMAQATGLDATDPEVRIARATTMRAFNDDDATRIEVGTLLDALQKEFPTDPRILGELGWLAKDVTAAEPWWDRLARVPGWAAAAGFNRAMRRLSSQDFPGGYAALVETSAHAKSTKVLLWKAYLEVVWLGDLAEARRTMAEVPADAFVEDMAASARYFVALWSRDYQQALAAVQAVPRDYMESGASISPTGYFRGVALDRLGRTAAAENEWRAALAATERRIEADRNNANLLLGKALLLAVLNDKAGAERVWRTARELQGVSGKWQEDYLAAMLLPPEQELERLEKLVHAPNGWMTAAVLRLNPYYDHLRENPRFIALQAEADANPRLSPTAAERARSSEPGSKPGANADDKSVAVLAFDNLSDDKGNEYFSDGISEELLTVLQKIPGLHVAARTSAFSFKGKAATAQEIGKTLGVANLVEGSVRKAGASVRISARLSRAATGEQLWSESYTRELKDVFAVQSEIAQTIVTQLRGQLGGGQDEGANSEILAQVRAAEKGGTKNVAAHELYLQGRFFASEFNQDGFARGIGCFRRALKLDPDYALAWAALSRTIAVHWGWGTAEDSPEEVLREARAAAERSLALAPDLAEGYQAEVEIQCAYDYDWRGAQITAGRALQLAPSDATNVSNAARVALAAGRVDQALMLAREAAALDPLNPEIGFYLVSSLCATGRLDEAAAGCQRMVELHPGASVTRGGWAQILMRQGRLDEAAAIAVQEPEGWSRRTAIALIAWAQKKQPEADAALRELVAQHGGNAAYQIAEVQAWRGDTDQAFAWLERAARLRDAGIGWVKTDDFFKPMRSDARWPKFLATVGLADEQLK